MQGWATKTTAALQFSNSYALNENAKGMPTGDLTVSFWAKTAAFNASQPGMADETFFSYATHLPAATTGMVCMDSQYAHALQCHQEILQHMYTFQYLANSQSENCSRSLNLGVNSIWYLVAYACFASCCLQGT